MPRPQVTDVLTVIELATCPDETLEVQADAAADALASVLKLRGWEWGEGSEGWIAESKSADAVVWFTHYQPDGEEMDRIDLTPARAVAIARMLAFVDAPVWDDIAAALDATGESVAEIAAKHGECCTCAACATHRSAL